MTCGIGGPSNHTEASDVVDFVGSYACDKRMWLNLFLWLCI